MIRVESKLGAGTTITLLLPAARDLAPPVQAERSRASEWRGRGAVLLIDDHDDAREVGAIVLERAGFAPLAASSGEEGVALFETHAADLVLVLLDLTMPGIDGVETYRRMRAIRPDVPVILCSGYPEHSALGGFSELGLAGFLQKPYSPAAMLDQIRSILDPPGES